MNRKSPQAHASLLPVGTKMRGSDLNLYIVTKRSNGTQFWEKYNGNRPSPNEHASTLALNTKLPGNDGFLYIVAKRFDNSKYWKKTEEKAPPKKQKLVKWYSRVSKKAIGKGPIIISVCEPYTNLMGGPFSGEYKITEEFYKVLLEKPKYVRKKELGGHNGYVFGPMYNKHTYTRIGSHGNDGAQTGIVEITNLTEDDHKNILARGTTEQGKKTSKWANIYFPERGGSYSWDERKLLTRVRKEISERILFVGSTDAGDVGADVYAHFNKKGEIDSLIIDNYMIFKDEIDAEIAETAAKKAEAKKERRRKLRGR